jgi:DNA invertase Pin-like site-specific DNA recombinase
MNNLTIASYSRFSGDTGEASIEHQQALIRKYATEKLGTSVNPELEYSDNGISGTTTNRLGFQQMLADAQARKFDVLIVKNNDRFSRNKVDAANLRDDLLPKMGIKYISLENPESSSVEAAFIQTSIEDMFAEYWPLLTSKKVRHVKSLMATEGKQLGNIAYGYKRDPNDKYHLIIDPVAAEIVKEIFNLRLQKMSFQAIATVLNDREIQTPAQYKDLKLKRPTYGCWKTDRIQSITKNYQYCGHTVNGKTATVSYKDHTVTYPAKSDWVIVRDTHEAIITEEIFNEVQGIGLKTGKLRTGKQNRMRLFSCLLKCSVCGSTLTGSAWRKKCADGETREYLSWQCPRHRANPAFCNSHFIAESTLIEIITLSITELLRNYKLDKSEFRKRYEQDRAAGDKKSLSRKRAELAKIEKRLDELARLIKSVYEKSVLENLNSDVAKSLLADYSEEQAKLQSTKSQLELELNTVADSDKQIDDFISALKSYDRLKTFDRETLVSLIDFIEVDEVGGERNLQIKYRV